jgi:hypothetical protein
VSTKTAIAGAALVGAIALLPVIVPTGKCRVVSVYGKAAEYSKASVAAEGYRTLKICKDTELPEGLVMLETPEREESKTVLSADLTAAEDFACACSTGAECEALVADTEGKQAWAKAPLGITLGTGQWRGAGCVKKSCIAIRQLASDPLDNSMPEACERAK